jgi:hypothetical protein
MFDADFLEDNFLRAETSEHDLLMEDFNEVIPHQSEKKTNSEKQQSMSFILITFRNCQ